MNRAAQARQRGVALVTAMLVVALATIAAVEIATRQQFDIRRSQNILSRDQAYSYAIGAEAWSLDTLKMDMMGPSFAVDHPGETWAQPQMLPDVGGAQLSLQIEDLQGRFNLNNLANIAPADEQNLYLRQFQRLLTQLDLEPNLAHAVIDWLDPDAEERFPGGAEDDAYSRLEAPYRAANRLMASATELRLVQGFDQEAYDKLAPHITALPQATPINVNTAKPEVLRLIHDSIDEQQAKQLADGRPEDGYASVNDFLAQGMAGKDVAAEGLSVTSEYFMLRTVVELVPARVELRSMIHRNRANKGLRIVARSQGPL